MSEPLKVVVYLCAEHGENVSPKVPMTDDALICQVPTCFALATLKYFTEVQENITSLSSKRVRQENSPAKIP
jgi:hypothetical protein